MTSRRRRPLSLAIAVILASIFAIPVSAAEPSVRTSDAAAPEGRLIVIWDGRAPSSVRVDGVRRTMASTGDTQRSLVIAKAGQSARVAAALRRDPRVVAVVPDAVVRPLDWPDDGSPSDPLYPDQVDLPQIGVPSVWPTTTGEPETVVAVIDTGVDLTHPDLAGVTVVAPRNELWNNDDVSDDLGHGTHVAGTIVARTDNGIGIAGIAPDVTLMPIKIFDDEGFSSFFDLLDAVDWARTHGADIINLSVGSNLDRAQVALVQPTFTTARAAGILMVAASGNGGSPIMEYPAGLNGVVSVGAVDADDAIAEFSTFNRAVDLTAPGVGTISTTAGDYEPSDGTSMASPHVSGVAALIWTARPGLEVDELEAVLRESAVDLGAPGRDDLFGSGRVDALAALTAPVPDPIPDLEPAPGPPGPFTIDFTAPIGPVVQTSRKVTVSWTTSHDVIDGVMVRVWWKLVNRMCPDDSEPYVDFEFLPFISPLTETLGAGFCYRYDAIAVDQEGEIAEALSPPISILDLQKPTIKSKSPAPGAHNVKPSTSIKVRFSEAVTGVSGKTLRLKNLSTGLWVKAKVTYASSSHTATINPSKSMFRNTRYAVYVNAGIKDPSGNKLTPTHWTFKTAR